MDRNRNLSVQQQQTDQINGNVMKRRTRIPDKPDVSLNLWSILKSFIGKDLTKIPLPVNFNEPLSMLQKWVNDQLEILIFPWLNWFQVGRRFWVLRAPGYSSNLQRHCRTARVCRCIHSLPLLDNVRSSSEAFQSHARRDLRVWSHRWHGLEVHLRASESPSSSASTTGWL